MKKILLSLIILALPLCGYAQITMSHAADKIVKEPEKVPYDSTKNYLWDKNVTSYVGQLLYVNGKSDILRDYGYDNFKTIREAGVTDHRYGQPSTSSSFNTKYEDLVGKYFIVKEVYPDSRQNNYTGLYKYEWWFLLENRDDPEDTVWFKYDGQFKHTFPFITISYFNYIKENKKGVKFVSSYSYKDEKLRTRVNEHDFYTGEEITQSLDDKWECIDVTIEDKYYDLVYVVRNQRGNVSTINVEITEPIANGVQYVFTDEEYGEMVKKFGKLNANRVLQHKVGVGMPETLVILSWGKPDKINRSSSGSDQWVYDNQYVYVENGVVTAWN